MWKERPYDESKESMLLKNNYNKLLARMLSQRDVGCENIRKFFDSPYKDLLHPFSLKGIKQAVDLFCDVAIKKGTIAVMGDYDCDGIISSAMIKLLCKSLKLDCSVFLPSRMDHGYGLNEKTLADFMSGVKDPPDLLFVLDCGSNNEKEVKQLREFGVSNVIIIDHHIVEEEARSESADVFVNWRDGCCDEMCTAGEVFQFIRGVRTKTSKVDPIQYLSYAAIATIADVMPLNNYNRIIVKNGLSPYVLDHNTLFGISSLKESSRIRTKGLNQHDVAFKISPKLNAAGRMFSPYIAYRLLIEEDKAIAQGLAEELENCNTKRKKLQKKIESEAVAMVKENPEKYKHAILLYKEDWHIGIIGIVAARLVEKFKRPAIILGKNGDDIKGSGRSTPSVNVKDALDKCSEYLSKYGGHSEAAGLTLKPKYDDNVDAVNEAFNKVCSELAHEEDKIDYYDIRLKSVSPELKIAKALLKTMYPYCNKYNPEPIFAMLDVKIVESELKEGDTWKLLIFHIEQNGEKVPVPFKMFSPKVGSEIEGMKANVYFTFPQDVGQTPFSDSLSVVDLELK